VASSAGDRFATNPSVERSIPRGSNLRNPVDNLASGFVFLPFPVTNPRRRVEQRQAFDR
jgi:hypothetical protein